MEQLTTIELSKEDLKFSAAHFTIFSAERRERLHGHNFGVFVAITAPVGPSGMCFSYKEIKDRIRALCGELDECTLIARDSAHLTIGEDGPYYSVRFGEETMLLLKSDTLLLPIRNTTVEEYARYLLSRLLEDAMFTETHDIREIVVKVSSGPGQWGSCTWTAG